MVPGQENCTNRSVVFDQFPRSIRRVVDKSDIPLSKYKEKHKNCCEVTCWVELHKLGPYLYCIPARKCTTQPGETSEKVLVEKRKKGKKFYNWPVSYPKRN